MRREGEILEKCLAAPTDDHRLDAANDATLTAEAREPSSASSTKRNRRTAKAGVSQNT